MGRERLVLDEDEERERYEDFPQYSPELDEDEWLEGARELKLDRDSIDDFQERSEYDAIHRDEVNEYLHELAEGLDIDISWLYDEYYGYHDD